MSRKVHWHNTMQCNAMQCNTIQYNTIQYNTMQCNTIYSLPPYLKIVCNRETIILLESDARVSSAFEYLCHKSICTALYGLDQDLVSTQSKPF